MRKHFKIDYFIKELFLKCYRKSECIFRLIKQKLVLIIKETECVRNNTCAQIIN